MKIITLFILLILWSCENTSKKEKVVKQIDLTPANKLKPSDSIVLKKQSRIENVRDAYFVGDIDKDKKTDSAIVQYDLTIVGENTIENECANKSCDMIIRFGNSIPELVISLSIGVYIEKLEDLNNDGCNEILVFSRWQNGYWQQINVYTLKNNNWINLANTKAFLSDDADWMNRIEKRKNNYYLLGDDWDNDFGNILQRKIKVKVKK
jgi:hypothetical protein